MNDSSRLVDTTSRLAKVLVDSGEVSTFGEANEQLRSLRLSIKVGKDVAQSFNHQAGLLTAVNVGRRAFIGGVFVGGHLDVPCKIPGFQDMSLREAVEANCGVAELLGDQNAPLIVFGDSEIPADSRPFGLRVTFEQWRGGVVPLRRKLRLSETADFPLGAILGAAIAVSEAFRSARGDAMAGRRPLGLSLWEPDAACDWMGDCARGPAVQFLPSKIWIIGLGNLGQAFLWALGCLPYEDPKSVELVLQDYDTLSEANLSTSILTTALNIGKKKTRAMAIWLEARNFQTMLNERRFDANFKVDPTDPQLAFCGVDNARARAALEEVGFKRIVEAGLGSGVQDFTSLLVHTFPASITAKKRWSSIVYPPTSKSLLSQPGYAALSKDGYDECGITMLASRTVGAPFVSAVAACLALAEILRMLNGGRSYEIIEANLLALTQRVAVPNRTPFEPFNPGFARTYAIDV
jgi:hypothetical protein